MIALATEHGFTQWRALGTIVHGWALSAQGYTEEGIVQMRQGLDVYRATGGQVARGVFLIWLSRAHLQAGQTDAGLCTLDESWMVAQTTGERMGEAERHRVKGELVLQRSPAYGVEAETCFHQVLDVSCH